MERGTAGGVGQWMRLGGGSVRGRDGGTIHIEDARRSAAAAAP